ncbi:hypothetical protein J1605_007664 [Eschrichtius robustus]|uniref:Uncharacterized protein n=1 Tax=Eschrichtius robustus TaxID=9764 RepID=A0AB34H052_ESCRO|nr:hypothetical protein J1605_007664 [Eschrichtius robustus]
MTGQGQSASGSSAWSTVFRHVRYENLVAGVSGGVLSNLALHPLDLVKIRFAGEASVEEAAVCPGSPGARFEAGEFGKVVWPPSSPFPNTEG